MWKKKKKKKTKTTFIDRRSKMNVTEVSEKQSKEIISCREKSHKWAAALWECSGYDESNTPSQSRYSNTIKTK